MFWFFLTVVVWVTPGDGNIAVRLTHLHALQAGDISAGTAEAATEDYGGA